MYQITDQGLQYLTDESTLLSGKLKGVHTINLHGCNRITDQGLQYLAGNATGKLKGVHTINLHGCNQITDQGLKFLKGVHHVNL